MKPKKLKTIKQLKTGNVVRHVGSGFGYVVTANYGDYAIAVRTVHISNPSEWEIVQK